MAGITQEQAQAQLDYWMAALTAVGARKSYSIGTRTITYQDIPAILQLIEYWSGKVQAFALTGRARARTIVPGW